MEDLHLDPDLTSLEEMIVNQRWDEPYLDEDTDSEEEAIFLIPQVPFGFRPAA